MTKIERSNFFMKSNSHPTKLLMFIVFFVSGFALAYYLKECDYSALDTCYEELRKMIDERDDMDKENQQLDKDLRKMYMDLERLDNEYDLEVLTGDSLEKGRNLGHIVSKMDSIINATNKKLDSLQNDSKNPSIAILRRTLSEVKEQIREKELEIDRLRNDNEVYLQIVDLQSEQLQDIQSAKDSLMLEIDDLSLIKEDLMVLIEDARRTVSDTIGALYFNYGLDLINDFEQTRSGFLGSNNKLKKNLINNAFKCFRLSCKNYHPEAENWIIKLVNNPQYNKFLEIKTGMSFNLSNPCSL